MERQMIELPWKEMAFIILLIWLNLAMSQMRLNQTYVSLLTGYASARFIVFFVTAYFFFGMNVKKNYPTSIKIFVSLFVAVIFHVFFSAQAQERPIMQLHPPK